MRLLPIAVSAVLWAFSSIAYAQGADEWNDAGVAAFQGGDFVGAAENFGRAYAADADPIFRKSEAVAWFKAERCDEAITAANAFLLQWRGAAEETDEAASVVANCKVTLANSATEAESYDLAERLLFEADAIARDQYTRDRISAARVELATRRAAVKDVVVAPPPQPPPRSIVPAIATISVGGALVATAAVLHIVTLTSTVGRLKDAQTGAENEHARIARSVDTARILVPTLYAAGGAVLGVGVWLWIKPGRSVERESELSAGLSWSRPF